MTLSKCLNSAFLSRYRSASIGENGDGGEETWGGGRDGSSLTTNLKSQ